MGKFGIVILLMCTFFIPQILTNSPAEAVSALPAAATSNTAVAASDCSVDPKFVVTAGAIKADSGFGVKTGQPGVDAKFAVPVCKGISGVTPPGK